ncbi:MAG: amylo-alpha-1,6-glucosidase [Pyrinomonadaceae bacterium]
MILLDQDICGDFAACSSREWLETNGIGSYASSTVSGANTRRYHAMLVAAMRPPLGRVVLVSKFEETVIVDGERFDLSSNQYPGAVYPEGFKFITEFRLDPYPIWIYSVAGLIIEKSVFMVHGENTTVCRWRALNQPAIPHLKLQLELRPLLAVRDHHDLRREDHSFDGLFEFKSGYVHMNSDAEMPSLHFAHNAVACEAGGEWYHNFEYAIEAERGFGFHEDLYQPFALTFDLSLTADIVVSTERRDLAEIEKLQADEIERRENLLSNIGTQGETLKLLTLAADQFIVDRGGGKTIIAGYHWFSDWGRDTMIALPGLTLATGRPDIAKTVITEFAKHISQGMIPNRFPDLGEMPEYNNVDATLWFLEAIRAYVEHTGEYDFVRVELYDKLRDIIDWHVRGTRYNIHVDTDGLLFAGEEGTQLTWMDAKIGDWVATPRIGKPVEIQALWYNALRIMAEFATRFGIEDNFDEMADIARESFNGQFWNGSANCLFDVVNSNSRDASIRPNQIFAVSLKHSMLSPVRALAVVEKVESELLTPYGLRSLSRADPRYVGTYVGSPQERDASYHQGPVWAWLVGPFVEAYRRVHPDDASTERFTTKLREHLSEAMLGQICEIFDGDAPHAPRGCAAQAWSVGELLRASEK